MIFVACSFVCCKGMVLCRGSLLPDPRYDAVRAVFLAVMDDVEECPDGLYTARLLLFDETGTAAKDAMDHVQASYLEHAHHTLHVHALCWW